LTSDEIKAARALIAAATPVTDKDGNEYYLEGIPITDMSTGNTTHRFVEYSAERFADQAREGWSTALDYCEALAEQVEKLKAVAEAANGVALALNNIGWDCWSAADFEAAVPEIRKHDKQLTDSLAAWRQRD